MCWAGWVEARWEICQDVLGEVGGGEAGDVPGCYLLV